MIALLFFWSTLLCQQAGVVAFAFQSISILPTRTRTSSRVIKNNGPCRGFLCPPLKMSGRGTANEYSWTEEAFELEVTVLVPKETRAKDIVFKANSTSIRLALSNSDNDDDDDIVLLDPARKLRGRVIVDGTYWMISDPERSTNDKDDDPKNDNRLVTVTIEKRIRRPKDDFDIVDYDWKGVYSEDEVDNVTVREYDVAEKLDVREYANSLGVDIDNINMSMVDKVRYVERGMRQWRNICV